MGFYKQTIKGISWVSFLRILSRSLAFLKSIIIARIILPSEFGIFGIISMVLTFLEILTETGINVLLIQTPSIDLHLLNSAWIISIFRGVLISFLMFVSKNVVANFFHSPSVAPLMAIASAIPLIKGFINPSVIKFQKDLKFNQEFKFKFLVFLIESSSSIILILILKSVTALVLGMILGAISEVIFSFLLISPKPKFELRFSLFRDIFKSGKWITLATIFNYFFTQGDSIFTGRILGTSSLGIYQMAYKLAILPITEITDVISRVTFPVYVKINQDKKRLEKAFLKTLFGTVFLVSFPSLIFYFFSKEFINLIFGAKWLASAPVLKILAFYAPLKAFLNTSIFFFYSVSKQKYVTLLTFLNAFFLFSLIFPLIQKLGIQGVALSVVFSLGLTLPFNVVLLIRSLK